MARFGRGEAWKRAPGARPANCKGRHSRGRFTVHVREMSGGDAHVLAEGITHEVSKRRLVSWVAQAPFPLSRLHRAGRLYARRAAAQARLTTTPTSPQPPKTPPFACERKVVADVVAIDQPLMYNRMGAGQPNGMMYALKRDVVATTPGTPPGTGNAMLRPDKRPRPLVLRAAVGDCLTVHFTNWLSSPQPGRRSRPLRSPRRRTAASTCPPSAPAGQAVSSRTPRRPASP